VPGSGNCGSPTKELIELFNVFATVSRIVVVLSLSALSGLGNVSAQESGATPAALTAMTGEEAIAAVTADDGVLRFDVSENATRFVFGPDLLHDDGLPAYGAWFVTQGYIYPADTLDETNGVNADGSPEFPDQVLGQWICRGVFIGDGAHTSSGSWVITTQTYNFGSVDGEATIVSDGHEVADLGVTIDRAVIGGTGPFVGAEGTASQSLLGFNVGEGVNLEFEISLTGADA
jgi:hypothetical protein